MDLFVVHYQQTAYYKIDATNSLKHQDFAEIDTTLHPISDNIGETE